VKWKRPVGPITIPNALSGMRLAIAPVLLVFAWMGESTAVLVLLGVSFLSDFADGYLARKLDQVSEFGGELDSWGDLATYLAVPVCFWWLWPDLLQREVSFVVIVVTSYTLTTTIGLFRYRRLMCFHTWGGKVSGVLLGGGGLLLLVEGSGWLLRLATAVVVIADLEELAMMAVLPRWRPDVPSLWHALNAEARR